jgi:hypothetical protein
MPRRVEALGRLPVFRAAGSAGPGGNATPGRVLGSGEDVRTVPSWRPLRSASNGAPARSHHEELAEKAPTNAVPGVYRWRASLWRHFCATTMEAAGGTAFEWPQAVSGSPQWVWPHQPSRWMTRLLAVALGRAA